jgi:hypothetical protein
MCHRKLLPPLSERDLLCGHQPGNTTFPAGKIRWLMLALLFGSLIALPADARTLPPYVGKWYSDDAMVCGGTPNETEGLLTYTAREFLGIDNRCRINRVARRRDLFELSLRCTGEGETYNTTEKVKVVDGALRRCVRDGGKWWRYTYRRCAAK